MKRICLAPALCLCASFAWADNRTYYLYTGTTDTGVTTVASGVSTLVIEGHGANRSQSITDITGLEKLKDGTAIFQVIKIAPSQHAMGQGGDNTGTTFTVRYYERVASGVTWSLTQSVDVISGMALTGNTLYQIPIFPQVMGEQRWEIVSGVTPLDYFKAMLRYID